MKKTFLSLLLIISICSIAAAQTITISGTVQDKSGNYLRYAFVQDKQLKSGVYTDSLGHFSVQAQPNGQLRINCAGYKDAVINVSGKNEVVVTLQPDAAVNNNAGDEPANTALQDALVKQMDLSNKSTVASDFTQGSVVTIIHTKDATQGSPYFFKDWAHGYIVNAQDTLIQSPGFLLNYDKMKGVLILTKDKVSMISIYQDKVKSFTLFDVLNQQYTFTIVPEIDKSHYVQVISVGNNYKIYKAVKTKFIPSNYSNDGLASTGNNFDLYDDEFTYYLLNVKTSQLQKITLKKKALKQAFGGEEKKADDYFKSNAGDIDDNYLAALGDYMNK
jgi:hypothetical protein